MPLDVCSDAHGFDLVEVNNAACLAPAEELRDGLGICRSRVTAAYIRSEKLNKTPSAVFASARGYHLQVFKVITVKVARDGIGMIS